METHSSFAWKLFKQCPAKWRQAIKTCPPTPPQFSNSFSKNCCFTESVVVALGALWLMLDLSTKIMAMTLVWPPPSLVCVITCCLLPVTHFSLCSNSLHAVSEGNSIFLSLLSLSCCCGVKAFLFIITLTKHSQPRCFFVHRHCHKKVL